jgi:hypothetical protein
VGWRARSEAFPARSESDHLRRAPGEEEGLLIDLTAQRRTQPVKVVAAFTDDIVGNVVEDADCRLTS